MCRTSLKVDFGPLQHGCTTLQPSTALGQVEIQPSDLAAGLGTYDRARRSVVVQHPPAVPVVAALRQVEPTTKQRKVSRRQYGAAHARAELRAKPRNAGRHRLRKQLSGV